MDNSTLFELVPSDPINTMDLSVVLHLIVSQYFNNFKCIYFFRDDNYSSIGNFERIPYVVSSSLNITYRCDGLVIISRKPREIFDHLENYFYVSTSYQNIRKYIIISDNAGDVFQSKNINFIFDLLAVKVMRLEEKCYRNFACETQFALDFFTHKYGGFRGNDLIHLDTWSSLNGGSFLHNSDLFPDKLNDQNGRTLHAAAFTYIPYANLDNGLGSEMQLAKEFARRHNNNLVINREYPWGQVYGNRSGTGILGTVVRDESDFAFTGVFSWFRNHDYLDYSHDFIVSKVTCITPSPRIDINWRFLMPSYSVKFLLVYFSIIFVAELIVFASTKKKFIIIMTQVSQSIPYKLKRISARLIFIHLLFLGLIMTSIYSSGLSSIITVPNYVGKIDTPKQLAKSNLTWVGTQISSWTDNIIYDEQEEYKLIVKNAEEFQMSRINDKTVAYAIEKLQTNYYAFDEFITEEVIKSYRAMEGYIYTTHCIFAFRKNSVLLPIFNKLLLRAQASGLGLKWETDAIIQSSLRKQHAMDFEMFKVRGKIRLNFPRFVGVMMLWSCGLSIAIFSFLAELIIHRCYHKN